MGEARMTSRRAGLRIGLVAGLLDRFTWPEAIVLFARGLGAAAAELETSTPKHAVTPGPTLPAYELLGDLLMEQKQPAEALVAYKRSLALHPGRLNGLLGAARAARKAGDKNLARTLYQELLQVDDGATRQPALKEAQGYLAEREQ